jgi:hypothetical protein
MNEQVLLREKYSNGEALSLRKGTKLLASFILIIWRS